MLLCVSLHSLKIKYKLWCELTVHSSLVIKLQTPEWTEITEGRTWCSWTIMNRLNLRDELRPNDLWLYLQIWWFGDCEIKSLFFNPYSNVPKTRRFNFLTNKLKKKTSSHAVEHKMKWRPQTAAADVSYLPSQTIWTIRSRASCTPELSSASPLLT